MPIEMEEDTPQKLIDEFLAQPSAAENVSKKYGRPNQIGQIVTATEISTFQPALREKINQMIKNKEAAISQDDFDRGVNLRNAIEFLRDKGREYRDWQEMKQVSIQNEDYEVAKRFKMKMDNEKANMDDCYGVDVETGKMSKVKVVESGQAVTNTLEQNVEQLA